MRKSTGGQNVREWLDGLRLEVYAEGIVKCPHIRGKSGTDMLSGVLQLGDLGLTHFGVSKMGHRCKIRFYAKKQLDEQGFEAPETRDEGSVSPVNVDSDSESAAEEPVEVAKEEAPVTNASKTDDIAPAEKAEPPNAEPPKPAAAPPAKVEAIPQEASGGDDGFAKVANFLEGMQLQSLVPNFREAKVTWDDMVTFEPKRLTALGCKMGPRARIMAHLPSSAMVCRAASCMFCAKVKCMEL